MTPLKCKTALRTLGNRMDKYSVIISDELIQKLIDQALGTYPEECCGILIGRQTSDDCFTITEIQALANLASKEERKKGFLTDPLAVYRCELSLKEESCEITGFYHSHPDKPAILSSEDKEHMIPGKIYLLISVQNKEGTIITAWIRRADDFYEAITVSSEQTG